MKLKAIEKICKEYKTIILINVYDNDGQLIQWISAGVASYPIPGMPVLTIEHIFKLFDIPEAKEGQYITETIDVVPGDTVHEIYSEAYSEELEKWRLSSAAISILYRELTLKIFYFPKEKKPIFLEETLLAPLKGMYDIAFYKIQDPEKELIIVKNGLLNAAVLGTYRLGKHGIVVEGLSAVSRWLETDHQRFIEETTKSVDPAERSLFDNEKITSIAAAVEECPVGKELLEAVRNQGGM